MVCRIDDKYGLFVTDHHIVLLHIKHSFLCFPDTKYDMMCDHTDIISLIVVNMKGTQKLLFLFEGYFLPPKWNLEKGGW